MDIKVSIIVPIYNVERYLDRCISSILEQTYQNIEIILVDDESPDTCPLLCEVYKKQYRNIVVIHKKNEGLGFARNTGLQVATGEYVEFLDSDDYIDPKTVEITLKRIVSEKADACFFSCKKQSRSGSVSIEAVNFPETLCRKDIKRVLFPNCFGGSQRNGAKERYRLGSSCMAMYRRKFLVENKISFESERNILSEDILFNIQVCQKAERITFLNENFYVYCENDNSLTHTYRSDRFEKACALFQREVEIIRKEGNADYSKEALVRAQDSLVSNLIVSIKQCVNNPELKKIEKMQMLSSICSEYNIDGLLKDYPFYELGKAKRLLIWMVMHKKTTLMYLVAKLRK